MKIERTLFWFKDGDEILSDLNERFFSLGTLLNRLLNEKYFGKRIQFINLDFSTERTYELYPKVPVNEQYFYGGHLRYFGVFDFTQFNNITNDEQYMYVWNKSYEFLSNASKAIKNDKLFEASSYAYQRGMELNLNPDYRVIEKKINFFGKQLNASVWINFKEDGMHSKFTLEKGSEVVYEKNIDNTKNGVELFLEMYKEITQDNDNIIIKGRKDVQYLPLKIPLETIKLKII